MRFVLIKDASRPVGMTNHDAFVSLAPNSRMSRRNDALLSLGRAWALRDDVTYRFQVCLFPMH